MMAANILIPASTQHGLQYLALSWFYFTAISGEVSCPTGSEMGLYTSFVSKLLFHVHERLKHHDTVDLRRLMEEVQWWPADRIAAFQLQRLCDLLRDVGAYVPYYRDLFAQVGFDICPVFKTGGSSGEPLIFLLLATIASPNGRHPPLVKLTLRSGNSGLGLPLS
jgi:phenylacetate-CoA ligase